MPVRHGPAEQSRHMSSTRRHKDSDNPNANINF